MFEVYCHTSPSGKRYVGWTSRGTAARWRKHVGSACAGSMLPLHCAIRKHGADSFRHELLEQCDTEAGAKRAEVRWIASRGTQAPRGYNATAGGDGSSNPSAYVRELISAAHRGKTISADQRQRLRALNLGKRRGPHSAETREKIGASQRGRKLPAAHVAKLCDAHKRRAPVSQDTRKKMADAWTPAMRAAAADRIRKQKFLRSAAQAWARLESNIGVL